MAVASLRALDADVVVEENLLLRRERHGPVFVPAGRDDVALIMRREQAGNAVFSPEGPHGQLLHRAGPSRFAPAWPVRSILDRGVS